MEFSRATKFEEADLETYEEDSWGEGTLIDRGEPADQIDIRIDKYNYLSERISTD